MSGSVFRLDSVSVASDYTLKLSDFTMEIREGEITGVIGPSNSGKTSLCHVLTGRERWCGGALFYRDRRIHGERMPKGVASRVALIDGSSVLAPSLKVSELLALVNPERMGRLFVNRGWVRSEAQRVLDDLSIVIDSEIRAMNLTAAQRHLILIAEAYLRRVELIALNNTVSSYTDQEWEMMRRTLHIVLKKGIAVLLTSNKGNRLLTICDHIAVLAQGTNLKIFEPERYPVLQNTLSGRREMQNASGFKGKSGGGAVFSAAEIHTGSLCAGQFELYRGEIVGFYDPNNVAGQELFAALMEMDRDSGHYELEGETLSGMNAVKCMDRGIGFIPDGAVENDLFLQLSVMDNILCSSKNKLGSTFLMRGKAIDHLAATCASAIGVDQKDMYQKAECFGSLERLRIYLCRWALARRGFLPGKGPP